MAFRTKKIYKENIIHAFCPTSSLVIPRASKNMKKELVDIKLMLRKQLKETEKKDSF